MNRKKLLEHLEARAKDLAVLDDKWREFKAENTYLTYRIKQKFIEALSLLKTGINIPWYYRIYLKLFYRSRFNDVRIAILEQDILHYNEHFVRSRLEACRSFFDGRDDGLKYPLDPDQRLAVIRDDFHNLVIAGAGSGKTSVLTSRIAYLVRRRDRINPDRILALAFTNVAADEMKSRLKRDFKIDISISTFHSLGRRILKDELGYKPRLLFNGSERKKNDFIRRLFTEVISESRFQQLLIEYLAYHDEQEVTADSFEDQVLYYKYMRNKKYTTLNDINVKSISERDIGNFLFLHSIKFEYEPVVDWVDHDDSDDRDYRPDFYLVDHDVYIEHWGLNKSMQVPQWFTKTSEEYLKQREWKIEQFKKHGKTLIETWDYERHGGTLIDNLKKKLEQAIPGIKFTPLTYMELIQKTNQFRVKSGEIASLIVSFISTAKSNFLTVDDIAKRVNSKNYSRKQRIFGEIALAVYRRYQSWLKENDVIDFDDMINQAVILVRKQPEKYREMYDHVLVDEFQDISYQRMELIKLFVNPNSNTKLFCVGDDWQSIYQFTGSDVRFFIDFKQYFPNPAVTVLKRNYRSTSAIVRMSNDLIARNKFQLRKEARSTGELGLQPIFFELSRHFGRHVKNRIVHYYQLIRFLLGNGVKPADIMVLSRFKNNVHELEIYCGANGIPTEDEHGGVKFWTVHKSKGSESTHVIIIDVISGLYGFPCEIQDSSVLEMARRLKSQGYIEEERRLFYVALTRSKKFLYLFSVEDSESLFLHEISKHLIKIHVDSKHLWDQAIPNLLDPYLKRRYPEKPVFCPECGKVLKKRAGTFGKFLGCTGYPKCRFTFDLENPDARMQSPGLVPAYHANSMERTPTRQMNLLYCPRCGNPLTPRNGKYGIFLGCSRYPSCTFTFNPSPRPRKRVSCPQCGGYIVGRHERSKVFLICSNYPRCNFIVDISKKS
ncbi:MAG: UvrD-helicase domain-containing protein [Promethearchaeota archaeon]